MEITEGVSLNRQVLPQTDDHRDRFAASIASALCACSAAALSSPSFARWIRSDRSRTAASSKVGRSICPVDKAKRELRPAEARNASAKEVSVFPASIYCRMPFNRAPTSAAPGKSSTRYLSAKLAWDDPAIKQPVLIGYWRRQACLQAGMQRKNPAKSEGYASASLLRLRAIRPKNPRVVPAADNLLAGWAVALPNENSPEMTSRSARHARPVAGAIRTPSARGRNSTAGTAAIPTGAPRPRPVRCG